MDGSWLIGVIGGMVATWLILLVLLWLLRPRDTNVRELLRLVPDVLQLIRTLLADRTTPFGVRVALLALLAWLVSPIDLIPEFIPVLGPLDDAVVAVVVLRWVGRQMGREQFAQRWPGSADGFALFSRLVFGA